MTQQDLDASLRLLCAPESLTTPLLALMHQHSPLVVLRAVDDLVTTWEGEA
jgi:hypothetical protein